MTPQKQSALSTYQIQDIETASPEKLLIMLYDGAIRFLKKAKEAMQRRDYQTLNNNMKRGQDIIAELMGSLNFEIGGDIAKNLFALYEYYNYRLLQSNIKTDPEMIQEVIEHLQALKKTWEEAIVIAQKEAAGASLPLIETTYKARGTITDTNNENHVPDEASYIGTAIDA